MDLTFGAEQGILLKTALLEICNIYNQFKKGCCKILRIDLSWNLKDFSENMKLTDYFKDKEK